MEGFPLGPFGGVNRLGDAPAPKQEGFNRGNLILVWVMAHWTNYKKCNAQNLKLVVTLSWKVVVAEEIKSNLKV